MMSIIFLVDKTILNVPMIKKSETDSFLPSLHVKGVDAICKERIVQSIFTQYSSKLIYFSVKKIFTNTNVLSGMAFWGY